MLIGNILAFICIGALLMVRLPGMAMEKGSDAERNMIRDAFEQDGLDRLDDIQAVVESTGALEYTSARAREAADMAINALTGVPESEYKQAMIAIADFAVKRRS